jgi:hypothetical protein
VSRDPRTLHDPGTLRELRAQAARQDRLVGALVAELTATRARLAAAEERMRGILLFRRIAAEIGVPQSVVRDAFYEWLRSKDFADVKAKLRAKPASDLP